MPVVCIVRFCFSFVFVCVFWFGMFIFVLEFVFLFSGRVVFFCFGISAFVSLWFVFLDFVSVFYFFYVFPVYALKLYLFTFTINKLQIQTTCKIVELIEAGNMEKCLFNNYSTRARWI